MTPEARQKFKDEEKQYDNRFRMQLLKDIPYFHHLYLKYNDPKYLEIVSNLDKTLKKMRGKLSTP